MASTAPGPEAASAAAGERDVPLDSGDGTVVTTAHSGTSTWKQPRRCRFTPISLLREPADAADALQDTFLIAAARLRELRDPARLRPWFYAVARNECLRRLRAGKAMAAPAEAKDVLPPPADVSRDTERADLPELVRTAIFGLNPGERDVIELSLVHELEGHDLADVLGGVG